MNWRSGKLRPPSRYFYESGRMKKKCPANDHFAAGHFPYHEISRTRFRPEALWRGLLQWISTCAFFSFPIGLSCRISQNAGLRQGIPWPLWRFGKRPCRPRTVPDDFSLGCNDFSSDGRGWVHTVFQLLLYWFLVGQAGATGMLKPSYIYGKRTNRIFSSWFSQQTATIDWV